MPEARRSKRVRTILGVKIVFNNRMSIMDCVVKNISSSGAKLVLPDTAPCPSKHRERARAVEGFPNGFPIVRVVLPRTPVETPASGVPRRTILRPVIPPSGRQRVSSRRILCRGANCARLWHCCGRGGGLVDAFTAEHVAKKCKPSAAAPNACALSLEHDLEAKGETK
jgi:hypothetical protein